MSSIDDFDNNEDISDNIEDDDSAITETINEDIIHFKEALTDEDKRILMSEFGDDVRFGESYVYVKFGRLDGYKPNPRIFEKISHIKIFDSDYYDDDFYPPLCFFPSAGRDNINLQSYNYPSAKDLELLELRLCRAFYLNAKIISKSRRTRRSRKLPKPIGKIISIDEFNIIHEIDITQWNEFYSQRNFKSLRLYRLSTSDGIQHSIYISVIIKESSNIHIALAFEG